MKALVGKAGKDIASKVVERIRFMLSKFEEILEERLGCHTILLNSCTVLCSDSLFIF